MSLTAQDLDAFFDSTPTATRVRPRDAFAAWRTELGEYALQMKGLRSQQPDEAMAWLSSVSARLLEMQLFTLEHDDRAATKFRVETVIPFREETRFQYQVASRRHSVEKFEWDLAGGQAT